MCIFYWPDQHKLRSRSWCSNLAAPTKSSSKWVENWQRLNCDILLIQELLPAIRDSRSVRFTTGIGSDTSDHQAAPLQNASFHFLPMWPSNNLALNPVNYLTWTFLQECFYRSLHQWRMRISCDSNWWTCGQNLIMWWLMKQSTGGGVGWRSA